MNRRRIVALAVAACVATTAGCGSPSKNGSPASQRTATTAAPATRPDPYAYLPKVPSFTVTSDTVKDGRPLPTDQLSGIFKAPGGKDISPQLSWSGFPARTKSFVVSMYDPQAPTGSGWWHWVVADIPATATSLPAGAGVPASRTLPAGAFQLNADAGTPRYIGGAPPPGAGPHDFTITVSALDVDKTELNPTSSAALLGFTIAGHTIARATLVCPTAAA